MPITHGAVRRASGAGPGWASFQTTGCLGHTEREIEGGKKIREEIERLKIKDRGGGGENEMGVKRHAEIKVGKKRRSGG